MSDHLIACVLGGTASGARTELHDVAFAVGRDLESVHEQLLQSWFGEARGLHVDAWSILDSIEGYRVCLRRTPANNGLHLYFINIGGYRHGEFGERHAWWFFGAANKSQAKARAKATLLRNCEQTHKDDMYDVDECLQLDTIAGWHIHLEADPDAAAAEVINGYFPLPAKTINTWLSQEQTGMT